MSRINLELGQFDVELILKVLKDARIKAMKEEYVGPHWVRNSDCSEFEHGHWTSVETKESRRLKSTINFIEKQIDDRR